MKKKILSVMLGAALAAAMMSGCGSSGTGETKAAAESGTSKTTEAASS